MRMTLLTICLLATLPAFAEGEGHYPREVVCTLTHKKDALESTITLRFHPGTANEDQETRGGSHAVNLAGTATKYSSNDADDSAYVSLIVEDGTTFEDWLDYRVVLHAGEKSETGGEFGGNRYHLACEAK